MVFLYVFSFLCCLGFPLLAGKNVSSQNKKHTAFSLQKPIEEILKTRGVSEQPEDFSTYKKQELRCCNADGTSCTSSVEKSTLSKAENHRKQNEEAESVQGSTVMHRTECLKVGIGS